MDVVEGQREFDLDPLSLDRFVLGIIHKEHPARSWRNGGRAFGYDHTGRVKQLINVYIENVISIYKENTFTFKGIDKLMCVRYHGKEAFSSHLGLLAKSLLSLTLLFYFSARLFF